MRWELGFSFDLQGSAAAGPLLVSRAPDTRRQFDITLASTNFAANHKPMSAILKLVTSCRHHSFLLLALVSALLYSGCGDGNQNETAVKNDSTSASPVATPALTPAPAASPASITLGADSTATFAPGNSFQGVYVLVNASITATPDGLKVHALNNDPCLRLPRIDVPPGTKLTFHAQIFSPAATTLQLFYSTAQNADFDEAHSVRQPIQQGDNDILIEITARDFKGNIRLDPGELPGDYLVKLIEVRAGNISSSVSGTASPTPH
jgi:hypothetical protein